MVLKLFKLSAIILFFAIQTPLAWGFSFEQTERYKQEAKDLGLAQSPQWLRLGHYHKTLFGGQKSKIRGSFFISPKGARDPEDELNKTIEALFSSEEQARLQCRYLARTQWLKEKLHIDSEDLIACPERDNWKKKLNVQEVFLIFASSDLSSAASSFGHTFLRLHNPDNKAQLDLIDYGLNFAAQTDTTDGPLFALKGLFGMYSGLYSMSPYHQKIRDYINLEGRDIWEYKINLTPAEVEMMINHMLELEGSYVPYYFLDDNCSYQILELLEVARPDLDLTSEFIDVTIPLDTLKTLGKQKNLLSGEKLRPSLQSNFQAGYARLSSAEKNELVQLIKIIRAQPRPLTTLEKPSEAAGQHNAKVLDTALDYLAIREYRNQKNYKEWKYQLAVERAALGNIGNASADQYTEKATKDSPLNAASSAALYVGYGRRKDQDFAQFKFRKTFHDLISRDDGVGPFTHMEALSLTGTYEPALRHWELEQFQLLKIISTNPVTLLDQPLSWKVSLGTEPQLNPFVEAGAGFSLDYNLGQTSRWIHLFSLRGFRLQEKNYLGVGAESIFVQKISRGLRALESLQFLGVPESVPFFRAEMGLSYDVSTGLEARLSLQRQQDVNSVLVSLVF